jgi:hypothetical protein
MALGAFCEPSDGVVPVVGGAVVAPGAAGLVIPAGLPVGLAPGLGLLGELAVWAQSAPDVTINRPRTPDIFFISQCRSQFG